MRDWLVVIHMASGYTVNHVTAETPEQALEQIMVFNNAAENVEWVNVWYLDSPNPALSRDER